MTTNEIFKFQESKATFEELLNHPAFSHTRFDPPWQCFIGTNDPYRHGTLRVYFRCNDSPSGVLLAGSAIATPENQAILVNRSAMVNIGPSRGEIACREGYTVTTAKVLFP